MSTIPLTRPAQCNKSYSLSELLHSCNSCWILSAIAFDESIAKIITAIVPTLTFIESPVVLWGANSARSVRLVEGPQTAPRAATRASKVEGGPRRQTRDTPCPICGFKTNPHHDGRAHRSQEPKRPFTGEELSEKGLAKVA